MTTYLEFNEPATASTYTKQKALMLFLAGYSQYTNDLDEKIWTPFRDIQVFCSKTFNSWFSINPAHVAVSGLTIGAALIANLPFLAKVFNKNETDNLDSLISSLCKELNNKEFDISPEQLEEKLNNDLFKQEANFAIRVKISQSKKKNLWGKKKTKTALKYEFSDKIRSLLQEGYNYNFDDSIRHLFNDISNITKALEDSSNDASGIEKLKNIYIALIQEIDNIDESTTKIDGDNSSNELLEILVNRTKTTKLHDLRKKLKNDPSNKKLTDKEKQLTELLEKVTAFIHVAPLFYRMDNQKINGIDQEITIRQSRQNSIDKINKMSAKEIASKSWDYTYDAAFNFWLFYMVTDFFDKTDNPGFQIGIVAMGIGLAVFHAGLTIVNFFKKKSHSEEIVTASKPIEHVDKKLTHNQLLRLFIKEKNKAVKQQIKHGSAQESGAANCANPTTKFNTLDNATKVKIKEIINLETEEPPSPAAPSWLQRMKLIFFAEATSFEDHIKTLDEYKQSTTLTSIVHGTNRVIDRSVKFSFREWAASVGISFAPLAVGAKHIGQKIYDFFNKSWIGAAISLGSSIIGAIAGLIYYKRSEQKEEQQEHDRTASKYDTAKEKIKRLRLLNEQNQRLIALINTHNNNNPNDRITPAAEILPLHNTRAIRRKTTSESRKSTIFKKLVNRASVFIGKLGTGILMYRLIPMVAIPLLSKIAILMAIPAIASVVTAFATIAWPVTVAGLVLSTIYACVCTYQYCKERQLEAAKLWLDNIDNLILAAEKHQHRLLQQLNYDYKSEAHVQTVSNQVVESAINYSQTPVFMREAVNDPPNTDEQEQTGCDSRSSSPSIEQSEENNGESSDTASTIANFFDSHKSALLASTAKTPSYSSQYKVKDSKPLAQSEEEIFLSPSLVYGAS